MRLLISAYACAPNRGSEHGSAWNWVTEANRLGHELWVFVSPAHRDAIEAASVEGRLKEINWIFPEISHWPLKQGKEPKWERTYNFLWQRQALRIATKLQAEVGFDLIHHLTWGGVRAPTFLGSLAAPLIIGPVGGGETSPYRIRDQFPLKGKILEAIRDISNATITINPLVRKGLSDAAMIFARTSDTRDILSASMRKKTRVFMEIGVPVSQIGAARETRQSPPRILYAGRFLYWKGVNIAIDAFASLMARMPEARFTIVGSGPEESRLKALAKEKKVDGNIDFVAWLPQHEFIRLYETHDIFLFPSLHDSTGWVVLESLCRGMPVVCFDLGGPKDIVTPESGVIVRTTGLDAKQTARSLSEQLHGLLSSPAKLAKLSAGAIARAHDFLLTDRVEGLYAQASKLTVDVDGTTVGQKALRRKPQSAIMTGGEADAVANPTFVTASGQVRDPALPNFEQSA
jgi:glycosyltransferase involved in cell wall biosynthesis